jgi:predicted GH43/DUF377 family glycosyl hydrolase
MKPKVETSAGWVKFGGNPVLGGDLGTCFDVCLLKAEDRFRMWFSWRPRRCIALVESRDGITWSEPVIALGPNEGSGWEDAVNRPVVMERPDRFHMWYTGQADGRSWIGHAHSLDGKIWVRTGKDPVLASEQDWENVAVMCPHVLWDEEAKLYRMWYSAGDQHEPNAIGYAVSPDGLTWSKHPANPIFRPDKAIRWERHKVTACQVVQEGGWHIMFYIGFRDEAHAQIGLARSRDGITGWQHHPGNPIIGPGRSADSWDHDAAYKPFAIFHDGCWYLWYNGRREGLEQIGLALREGRALGFDEE